MRHLTLLASLPPDARPAHNRADLRRRKSGRLRATEPVGVDRRRNVIWFCECDCGGSARVTAANFLAGKSKSCGCVVAEKNRQRWQERRALAVGSAS
jgi:hypothetical protein